MSLRSEPAFSLALAVIASAWFASTGCGASALGVQADMVALGGIAAAGADRAIVDVRAAELDALVEAARAECDGGRCDEERREHHRAALAAGESRWAPALACRAPVVEALRGWADGIEVALAAASEDIGVAYLLQLGMRFVSAWGALQRCLAGSDVEIPELPAPLRALGGE